MPNPKPAHATTIGHIRLTIYGDGGCRSKPSSFTIERRQNHGHDDWYPAAGFQIEELEALDQAITAAKAFLGHAPANCNSPNCQSGEDSVASQPGEDATEPPPFDPTPDPAKLPSGFTASRRPIRTPEDRASHGKTKTPRRPSKAKGRSR